MGFDGRNDEDKQYESEKYQRFHGWLLNFLHLIRDENVQLVEENIGKCVMRINEYPDISKSKFI